MTHLRARLAAGADPDQYARTLRRIARIQCIRTHYEYPPIPRRDFDWCAYRDPEQGHYGWGPTEAAAIADLLVNVEDWP